MSFDPLTAKLVGGFDPSTAKLASLPKVIDYSPVIGTAETALSLGSGMVGGVAGGFAGLGQAATNALGLTSTPAGDRVRQVADALTFAPRTRFGQGMTQAISAPFELLAAGADRAGGAVTDVTGSPAAGAAVNTAIQAAPMALGPAARRIPGESAATIAARQRAEALAAPVHTGIAKAREAGLKITPDEGGGGAITRTAAGLSGEPKLAKLASKKNAPVLNDLIRKDVGLPEDVPLSRQALADARKAEGAHYEAIKSVGRFGTDGQYKADLHAITRSFDQAAKDFSHRSENPFKKTVEGLKVDAMDAASAVEEVKLLRADADKAYRTGDPQLGKAYKDAALALDDQLDRHLNRHASAVSDPAFADAVAKYRAARTRIAKTYAADKALNESTGNIDAASYAKALKDGRKLSDEGLQVARFAQSFPRSTQRTERIGSTGPTIFDLLLGGGAGIIGTALGGAPGAAAIGLGMARPATRSLLLSDPVQSAMTSPRSYGPPTVRRLQDLIDHTALEASVVGVPAGQR